MNFISKFKSFSFDKNRDKNFGIKSAILWGYETDSSCGAIAYITKPKHVSQEDFDELLDSIKLSIKII